VLTSTEKPFATSSRIQGRASIVKALRRLLLRTSRFARGRARTREDQRWAAVVCDRLLDVLAVAELPPAAPKKGQR
jgi:hypothetical protein